MSGAPGAIGSQIELQPGLIEAPRTAGTRREALRNILRQRSAQVGIVLLVVLFAVALLADVIAPFHPNDPLIGMPGQAGIRPRAAPCIHLLGCPTSQPQHLLGTDSNVRDEFSRVVHGARISLYVGFFTAGLSIVVGTFIGAIAGYAGGWVDNLFMRVMDMVLAFPSLLLAIAIVTVLAPSLLNAQLAIAIVAIPVYARVMRASVLSVRELEYVSAARALGESGVGILTRRILPNALTPLIVQGTLGIATAILEVAALSFLGLGAQLPTAEWGSMIGLERNNLFSAPHLVLAPGFAISLTVLGFNLLGDGLRDALDPRLNR